MVIDNILEYFEYYWPILNTKSLRHKRNGLVR